MADTQQAPQSAPAGKKDNVFTRKIGPLPMWVWVAIIAAVILLWAYLSNKNSQSQTSGNATAPPLVITTPPEQDSDSGTDSTTPHDKHKRHHHRKHPGVDPGGPNKGKEGPEREWLEQKTGSDHPWTYLAKHHETVKVGPHGSRKIVKK